MKCPFCSSLESKVIDSRLSQGGVAIRRRRECEECEQRFTTYEKIEQACPIVIKSDETRQPFDRLKLRAGLSRACVKRPVSSQQIEQLIDMIERDLLESNVQEVRSKDIGNRVLLLLKDVDPVAYVRFASVYKDFKDVEEFTRELVRLRTAKA